MESFVKTKGRLKLYWQLKLYVSITDIGKYWEHSRLLRKLKNNEKLGVSELITKYWKEHSKVKNCNL